MNNPFLPQRREIKPDSIRQRTFQDSSSVRSAVSALFAADMAKIWADAKRKAETARMPEAKVDPLERVQDARGGSQAFVSGGLTGRRTRLQNYFRHVLSVAVHGPSLIAGPLPDVFQPSGENTMLPVVEPLSESVDYSLLDFAARAEVSRRLVEDEEAIFHWIESVLIRASDRSVESAIINSTHSRNRGLLDAPDTNATSGELELAVPLSIAKVGELGDAQADLLVVHPVTFAQHIQRQENTHLPGEHYSFGLVPILTSACPENRAVVLSSDAVQVYHPRWDEILLGRSFRDGQVQVVFSCRRSFTVTNPRGVAIITLPGGDS
jgi:hypothetical protein